MSLKRLTAILIAICQISVVITGSTHAQTPEGAWSQPVNLSHSGAASQLRLVAGPGGSLQAFWWDRFDGLKSSIFRGEAWSEPFAAPIPADSLQGTPVLLVDRSGLVHAFWTGRANAQTGGVPLFHSQMPIFASGWSLPDQVTDSAVAFDVTQEPSGRVVVAFIRTLQTPGAAAGVYVTRSSPETIWEPPQPAVTSIYFRLLAPEDALVRVAATNGAIHLVWPDGRLERYFYVRGSGGAWSAPEQVGGPDDRPADPGLAILPDGNVLLSWEAAEAGECSLMQQVLESGAWSEASPVLEGLSGCPGGAQFWPLEDARFWTWGEGTASLSLAGFDPARGEWSLPQTFGFNFEDPETGRPAGLSDLRAVFAGDRLVVGGQDEAAGEVWVSTAQAGALALAFAEPSPWSEPIRLSEEGEVPGVPAAAADGGGRFHVVWSRTRPDGPGEALVYARYLDGAASRPVEIAAGSPLVRQPALLADAQDRLHLAWVGGEAGEILYTRAVAGQAGSAGGWLPPQVLSSSAGAAYPQLGIDAAGQVYVLYVVPLNEGRGVYLVRSADGGETWSAPELVFDAGAAGWQMVAHPALAAAPDGTLHAAFVRASLPGLGDSQGVYYSAFSPAPAGSGESSGAWSEPVETAGPGADWPRLALSAGRLALAYGQTGAGVSVRWQDGSGGSGWGAPEQPPGFSGIAFPFGLAVDGGGALHLGAADPDAGELLYGAWSRTGADAAGGSWSPPERFAGETAAAGGAAAATPLQGGVLAVAWLGGSETAEALYLSVRMIPPADAAALPTPAPAEAEPEATQEIPAEAPLEAAAQPSPTPDLNRSPPAVEPSFPPLAVGGALAAFLMGVIFFGRVFWNRWTAGRHG